ncbi:hypothetical protein ACJIZ3_010514 [Penstemon smallii]|uniref:NB-ARC domain-containing protein n=1 Tax=Penstemon smallii TaxID=265156 RepID=A0ABD3UK73_9LAMI
MAYALQSLIHILEQDSDRLIDNNPQIESLLEKTRSLIDLLEKSSPLSRNDIKSLESPIRDAAHEAEDVIESHIRDQILSGQTQLPAADLKDVIKTFDSIKEEMSKIVADDHKNKIQADPEPPATTDVSSTPPVVAVPSSKNRVIGFDKDLSLLTDRLIGQRPTLEIIPLIGMGGIGKTTLARKLYTDLQKHFDIRAWVTVSQGYNMQLTLLTLLECLRTGVADKMHQATDDQLVDDIWDTQAWDQMRRFFPDNENGSRIMLTTRQSAVANHANSSSSLHHNMQLLDKDSSWELLVEKVFGEKASCPTGLRDTGRKISNNCGGLPLAISVMGGLLYASEKTLEFWDHVEKNVSSAITKHDVQFKNILSLSYNYLPYHLKPCFLYVGAFPEDYEIRVSKIVKLWMAEGFLKPVPNSSPLEDAAEAYLGALVDRNLLVVRRQESDGKIKAFSIHDLLRELCLKESDEEKFMWLKSLDAPQDPEEIIIRRVSAHSSLRHLPVLFLFLYFGLLRVLDVFQLEFNVFPSAILELVNLRYLAFTCHSALPSSISRFRNLQSLIIRRLPSGRAFALPSEVWEMTELRHIKSKETCIWYYPKDGKIQPLQDKLQTLSNLQMYGFTNQVVGKIPNIRKLGLYCNVSMQSVIDLASLQKLETLKCSSDLSLTTRDFLSYLTFPPCLQKLTLSFCRIPWGVMTTIGTSLYNLKQLKIQHSDFQGTEWMPNEPECDPTEPEWELTGEEEFPQLELLLLEDMNLVKWTSNNSCFESLKHLLIRECCSLKEIPLAIEESEALEKIEVDESSPFVVALVKQIQKNKLDSGDDIQVDVHGA